MIMVCSQKNEEESTDQNESDLPPLESDEEKVKERKGSKSLTPNKLLTRLPILLQQIKVGNNSHKVKNEIRKILYLLYQHNKIIKKKEENMVVVRDLKTSYIDFDWPKNVKENLKHENEVIIKSNESLAENKIKNEIKQLLLKHKQGNHVP